MRISDWSSDVCSSDLGAEPAERIDLRIGLPDTGGENRAAERPRTGVEHRARRGEVVGEAVVQQVAAPEAGGEQGAPGAPPVLAAALRIGDRTRREEDPTQRGALAGAHPAARGRFPLETDQIRLAVHGPRSEARSVV